MNGYQERVSGGTISSEPTATGLGVSADHSVRNRLWSLWVARGIAGHIDRKYYLSQVDEPGRILNPALHYVQEGAALGLDPSPDFSTNYYRYENLDVLRSGVNPYWHYIKYGRKEGRPPKPLRQSENRLPMSDDAEGDLALLRGHFDAAFYRASYPDLPEDDAALPRHYVTIGWLLGYDPTEWFSTQGYLRANPDVVEARTNPFIHYLLHGLDERRPLTREAGPSSNRLASIQTAMAAIGDEFDAQFYLAKYPDVANAGIDPLLHFCSEGCREGRDPCAAFSTKYYIQSNPDVADAGLNPFQHYVSVGRAEGRFPQHPAARQLDILERHDTLDAVAREWVRPDRHPPLMSEETLRGLLAEAIGNGRLILSISHDNYLLIAGGVQLCIQAEETLVRENGDTYLAIFPWQALPRLSRLDETPDVIAALALNGKNIGVVRTSVLISAVEQLSDMGCVSIPVVHQLLGHNPEQIVDLVRACHRRDCVMWLHDFVTLCPKFSLQRNDLAFCGAPAIDSNACSVCLYGEERATHLERIEAMFSELEIHMVSPSHSARAFWNARRTVEPASITVRPHLKLTSVRRKVDDRPNRSPSRAIRVGYLGAPMAHKGWNDFLELADTMDGKGFEFYHFAKEDAGIASVRFVSVHVKAGHRNAMVDALCQHDIDLVLHWASWPETFSFTTFEAMTAGAFVLTNNGSGNVAAAVKKHQRGCILGGLDALRDLFADSEKLHELVAARREMADRTKVRTKASKMSLPEFERARS